MMPYQFQKLFDPAALLSLKPGSHLFDLPLCNLKDATQEMLETVADEKELFHKNFENPSKVDDIICDVQQNNPKKLFDPAALLSLKPGNRLSDLPLCNLKDATQEMLETVADQKEVFHKNFKNPSKVDDFISDLQQKNSKKRQSESSDFAYTVDKILNSRKRKKQIQYLVKWQDSWHDEMFVNTTPFPISKILAHREQNGKVEYLVSWYDSWENQDKFTKEDILQFKTDISDESV